MQASNYGAILRSPTPLREGTPTFSDWPMLSLQKPSSVLLPLLVAALLAALALPGLARAQDPEPNRRFCAIGRPQPTCDVALIAVFTYYPRILQRSELESPFEVELGALVNRGHTEAVGLTLALGADRIGGRTALKGRYRRWIGRYAALDAAGGVAVAQRDVVRSSTTDQAFALATDRAYGLTGDVALGLTDWVSVGVRSDLLWGGGAPGPAAATYGTVRLGTIPGVIYGVLVFVASRTHGRLQSLD